MLFAFALRSFALTENVSTFYQEFCVPLRNFVSERKAGDGHKMKWVEEKSCQCFCESRKSDTSVRECKSIEIYFPSRHFFHHHDPLEAL